ncbi:MAG: hypothetical protein KC502_23270 [Myxococcales bacterium]|nr:hypothetical protein [Myxococcales bacterium]
MTPQANRFRASLCCRRWAMCVGWLVVTGIAATSAAKTGDWHLINNERGVKVYSLEDPKRRVPLLKARATIGAGLYHLLGILADVDRAHEWNPAVTKSKAIRRKSDFNVAFYVRIAAPWPCSDRDGIVSTGVKSRKGGNVVIAWFRDIRLKGWPARSGLVRFPRLRGHYRLTRLGPKKTRVDYRLDADAGGWLPDWALKYAVRSMPRDAVLGLRKQSKRTVGAYAAFIARHDPSRRPVRLPVTPRK